MVNNSCCVVNCTNTGRNSNCKFYTFPTASWKLERRKQWINAVRRKNLDGSPWTPRPTDCICSDHFVGGKKAEEEASPSYIPTIFPSIYKKPKINETTALTRHTRFLNRGLSKKKSISTTSTSTEVGSTDNELAMEIFDLVNDRNEKLDKKCQIDFLPSSNGAGNTFICNRYVNVWAEKCEAEIQTEIVDIGKSKCIFRKSFV